MDVTKENFKQALKEITQLLPSTTFISFDTEFTGLNSDPPRNVQQTPFDSLAKNLYRLNRLQNFSFFHFHHENR